MAFWEPEPIFKKLSVQLCQKLAKIGQKFTKIDPKIYKIVQIWSKNYKKSKAANYFCQLR